MERDRETLKEEENKMEQKKKIEYEKKPKRMFNFLFCIKGNV